MPDDWTSPRTCQCCGGATYAPGRRNQKFATAEHRLARYSRTRPVVRLSPARMQRLTEMVAAHFADAIAELSARGEL